MFEFTLILLFVGPTEALQAYPENFVNYTLRLLYILKKLPLTGSFFQLLRAQPEKIRYFFQNFLLVNIKKKKIQNCFCLAFFYTFFDDFFGEFFHPNFFCHIMSQQLTSSHDTSCHVTSHHATTGHVMSCHVTSQQVTSSHDTSCHVTSHHVTTGHVMTHHVKFSHVTTHYVTSHRVHVHQQVVGVGWKICDVNNNKQLGWDEVKM